MTEIKKPERIWLFDNAKAVLMFLVVLGHMFSSCIGESRAIRMSTLWIYTFHMPAFVFISGLLHKRNRPDSSLRWDKAVGFLLCGLALRYMNYFLRLLMGQHPHPHIIYEAGIPWYLFVMAEYEVFFWLIRKCDAKKVIIIALAASLVCGYFPWINDNFCFAKFINFMPFYAAGYYLEPAKVAEWTRDKRIRAASWVVMAGSYALCMAAPWRAYSFRKCFTGRRSYEFLANALKPLLGGDAPAYELGWLIRLACIIFASVLAISVLGILPDRPLGYVSTIGSRTLNVYFWHRIICYAFVQYNVYALAGSDIVYTAIGFAMTALLALPVFGHPANDILAWSKKCLQSSRK